MKQSLRHKEKAAIPGLPCRPSVSSPSVAIPCVGRNRVKSGAKRAEGEMLGNHIVQTETLRARKRSCETNVPLSYLSVFLF